MWRLDTLASCFFLKYPRLGTVGISGDSTKFLFKNVAKANTGLYSGELFLSLGKGIMLNSLKNKVLGGLHTLSERHFPISESIMPGLIKSEADTKEYRLIQLKNGLRALLISSTANVNVPNTVMETIMDVGSGSDMSDSNSSEGSDSQSDFEASHSNTLRIAETKEMAVCAVCVGVGTFSDPPEIPGLAHMLEHTVFMGSEKYPGDSNFDSFIKRHGGNNNGETDSERTMFYFECSENSLKEAMDRFAQFFISPLLSKEALVKERENVQSEFDGCRLSNSSRKCQVFYSLAPDGHPAKKFSWGNLKTLRDDVDIDTLYDAVHEFRKRHYSAHRMTLAVQGRLHLDALEKYVCHVFSAIPNNNLPPDDFTPYCNTFGNSDDFNKIIWMKPIKKMNQVQITWVLPSYVNEYKSRPIDYLTWLIDHEGDGSLSAFLSKKIWTLECEGGGEGYSYKHNSIYSLFSVFLKLTEDGFIHLKEVIDALFSYIAMLRENGPSKAIFDELEYTSRNSFRFRKEIHPCDYVQTLAESMQIYEPNHIIAGGNLYFEYKPELLTDMINHLTPDRANILILNENKDHTFYDKVEPWFGTLYKIEEIPAEWMESWRNCKATKDFHLPDPNPYISTNFELLEKPENHTLFPVKIIDDGSLEIWHRQDVKFNRPIGCYNFFFLSPLSWISPLNIVLLDVLLTFFDKKFIGKIYSANEANLFYEFYRSKFGVILTFNGYNQKLPLLFEEVLKLMDKYLKEIKDEENKILIEAIIKNSSLGYYNKLLKPDQFLEMIRYSLLTDCSWTSLDCLKELSNVTPQRLYDFGVEFFTKTSVLGLIQGNVTKAEAIALCSKFKSFFNFAPLEKLNPNLPVVRLTPGETYFKFKSFNPKASNSAIMNYYQFGPKTIRDSCIIDLLMMVMDDSLFNNLRTEQGVGYNVICEPHETYGILGFSINICFQSDKFDSENVDSRIDTFLDNFFETLKSIRPQEFTEIKKGLCSVKYNAELDLNTEVMTNFDEISTREYIFDRYQKEAAIIRELKLEDLCSWFENNILSSENYKKLSVQVVGPPDPSVATEKNENLDIVLLPGVGAKKDKFVLDLEEYKNRREFYPVTKCF